MNCTGGTSTTRNVFSVGPVPGGQGATRAFGQVNVNYGDGDQIVCTAENYYVGPPQDPVMTVTKQIEVPSNSSDPEVFLAALDATLPGETISLSDQTQASLASLNAFLSNTVVGQSQFTISAASSLALLTSQTVTLQNSDDTDAISFAYPFGTTSLSVGETASTTRSFTYFSTVNGTLEETSAVLDVIAFECSDQNGAIPTPFVGQFSPRPDTAVASCTLTNGLTYQRVTGGSGGGGGGALSDIRLKTAIKTLEQSVNGHRIYSFEYKPEVGIAGTYVGVMAQDLVGRDDHALVWDAQGKHWRVRYDLLGMRMATQAEYEKSGISALLAEYK